MTCFFFSNSKRTCFFCRTDPGFFTYLLGNVVPPLQELAFFFFFLNLLIPSFPIKRLRPSFTNGHTQRSIPVPCLFKRYCYRISYHFPPLKLSLTSYSLLLHNHFYALKTLTFARSYNWRTPCNTRSLNVVHANFVLSQLGDCLTLFKALSQVLHFSL